MTLTALAGSLLDWLSRPPAGPDWAADLTGLSGMEPLPWWAAASYEGRARHQLLRLRDHPDQRALEPWLKPLIALLEASRQGLPQPLLVPIPSWKRQSNPLPALITNALSQRLGWAKRPELLRRSRPVLGQHHLGRELRLANQEGAFLASPTPQQRLGPRQAVLLVDDILTTGATACAAAEAMGAAGWRVAGLACLARTPAGRHRGRDLRSASRRGDGPG
ncbi:MAG: phosphoribosyltransferase family protein [Cyanobacteriota bacterium]|jgi:predicted amidophosphoribosyltransferase|nr:phosphoribosyltransferase family protein [Cyanobacteriota bacterium]